MRAPWRKCAPWLSGERRRQRPDQSEGTGKRLATQGKPRDWAPGLCLSQKEQKMATKQKCFYPVLESLEDRIVPYAVSGYKWANLNVSASFMPNQTAIGTAKSDLFAKYDAKFSTATWERQFARALQTWASVTPLNFHFVNDDGSAAGAGGFGQGDSRFGDIRLGAFASTSRYLAYSYFPYPSTTRGGDIVLNSRLVYNIGTNYDLYSVLLHEAGHTLGLNHSSVYGSVMYPTIAKVYAGLSADDMAGIRAIYGARQPDAFDAKAANNFFGSATALTLDSAGAVNLTADLTTVADVDYYKVTTPSNFTGTLSVSVDARDFSLLAPKLLVYNASLRLVGSASTGSAYGTAAMLTLNGLAPGKTYYVVADGATTDVFGMGAYRLNVQIGTSTSTTTVATASSTTSSGGAFFFAAYALPMEGDWREDDHDHSDHGPSGAGQSHDQGAAILAYFRGWEASAGAPLGNWPMPTVMGPCQTWNVGKGPAKGESLARSWPSSIGNPAAGEGFWKEFGKQQDAHGVDDLEAFWNEGGWASAGDWGSE